MSSILSSSRKSFFTAGIFILLISIPFPIIPGESSKSFYENTIKLNPECKIKRMSNGTVIVVLKNQEGLDVKHQFTDFYADLLMSAYRKQRLNLVVNNIGKKYYLSQDDCRREIKHAINVLVEWNIVVLEEGIALR